MGSMQVSMRVEPSRHRNGVSCALTLLHREMGDEGLLLQMPVRAVRPLATHCGAAQRVRQHPNSARDTRAHAIRDRVVSRKMLEC